MFLWSRLLYQSIRTNDTFLEEFHEMKFSPFERERQVFVFTLMFLNDAHDKIYSYKIYVEFFQYIFKLVQFLKRFLLSHYNNSFLDKATILSTWWRDESLDDRFKVQWIWNRWKNALKLQVNRHFLVQLIGRNKSYLVGIWPKWDVVLILLKYTSLIQECMYKWSSWYL